ncbi:hypothetical protein [Pelagibacterium mangrovi]|uniref:hypothetical protein n=1 Tax=Pelagibacterium mangrovi TaxID=3119828 RepID=UPI002FC9D865
MTGRAPSQTMRTISVPTFLRFFMILYEYRERFAAEWPAHAVLDADFPERADAELNTLGFEQVLREYDGAIEYHRCFAAKWLESAGVPDHVMKSPAIEEFLRYQSTQAIRATAQAKPPRKFRSRFEPEKPDFMFDLLVAQRGAVGVFVAPGNGGQTATALFLNHGLPNGKQGIKPHHVRNALNGFVRLLRRSVGDDFEQWGGLARLPEFEVRVAYVLWRQLGGVPGKPGHAAERALLDLIETGEVHQAYVEAADRVSYPKFDPSRVLPLIEHYLGQLKSVQKKRGRVAKCAPVLSAGNATPSASG